MIAADGRLKLSVFVQNLINAEKRGRLSVAVAPRMATSSLIRSGPQQLCSLHCLNKRRRNIINWVRGVDGSEQSLGSVTIAQQPDLICVGCQPHAERLFIVVGPHRLPNASVHGSSQDPVQQLLLADLQLEDVAQFMPFRRWSRLSAWATVRGNPSRMKPRSESGFATRSAINPITRPSGTSSPRSMISATCRPIAALPDTAAPQHVTSRELRDPERLG